MINKLIIPCIAMASFLSCKEGNTTSGQHAAATETSTPADERYFYKRLEGTIANQPVVMHLHKTARGYDGIYYYRNVGQWLTLSIDSVQKDSIYFSEYTPGDNWSEQASLQAQLRGKLSDGSLSGVWLSGDGKKRFPFELKEQYPTGSYKFSFNSFADSTVAFPDRKGSPVAEIDYGFTDPKDNSWLDERLKALLGFDSSAGYKEGFVKSSTQYLADYKVNLPVPGDDTTVPLETYNYASTQTIYVRYNDNGFVVFEQASYEYSGGAHGNYGSTFYCFDAQGRKQLRLSDVLTADSATLQPIVEQQFRKQYRIKEGSLKGVLFEEHLALNDNFYLTDKGIGFLYNPYEVASYAQGQINVFVPFSAVKPYLTAYIRERLKI
jgi:hypothetical protein